MSSEEIRDFFAKIDTVNKYFISLKKTHKHFLAKKFDRSFGGR
jgi:hypothetical protein